MRLACTLSAVSSRSSGHPHSTVSMGCARVSLQSACQRRTPGVTLHPWRALTSSCAHSQGGIAGAGPCGIASPSACARLSSCVCGPMMSNGTGAEPWRRCCLTMPSGPTAVVLVMPLLRQGRLPPHSRKRPRGGPQTACLCLASTPCWPPWGRVVTIAVASRRIQAFPLATS